MSSRSSSFLALAIGSTFVFGSASAQIHQSGYGLPLALANEAALEAVRVCEANGYKVSVAVVDTAGELKSFAKGDNSTVHTKDTAFRKAYTVATLGPIFAFDALGPFVERLRAGPNAPALSSIPNIILLAGGVAVKAHGETVAAIGVGGAPGGEKDEACAAAALAKIKDRLPK